MEAVIQIHAQEDKLWNHFIFHHLQKAKNYIPNANVIAVGIKPTQHLFVKLATSAPEPIHFHSKKPLVPNTWIYVRMK